MPTSKEHYERVLGSIYSWMLGGHEAQLSRNRAFFESLDVAPQGSRRAIDLGAGSGFQSIPLAELGFEVWAVDLDASLLGELKAHADGLRVHTVETDLTSFADHCPRPVELVVCMTDTILHLESADAVTAVCHDVCAALEAGGRFILTFRDLTHELEELDRFLPVRSDADTILTCFLEYEPETVKVHDLVYRKEDAAWQLYKSFYRKLRLGPDWLSGQLSLAGFSDVEQMIDRGTYTLVAGKP